MSYILVVDDDASHRTLICDALEEMGYRTEQAANGREALDLLEGEMPQAVLLDLRMPVMSGWELLDRLQQEGPPTYTSRVHSCSKVRYRTFGTLLAQLGVNTASTTALRIRVKGIGRAPRTG